MLGAADLDLAPYANARDAVPGIREAADLPEAAPAKYRFRSPD